LRAFESALNRHTPVIALTANAFREDMERSLAAGMDDFLSKPVTFDRLARALAKWVGEAAPPSAGAAEAVLIVNSGPSEDPVDMKFLAHLLGTSDPVALKEILAELMRESEVSWFALKSAAANTDFDRDASVLADAVHGAKGEAHNGGARVLGGLYAELEQAIKRGAFHDLPQRMAIIEAEVDRLKKYIAHYLFGAAA
jgi:HPt (histidine-containing phosphotransfer) domain-containing protein